jgi:hypothetical protein
MHLQLSYERTAVSHEKRKNYGLAYNVPIIFTKLSEVDYESRHKIEQKYWFLHHLPGKHHATFTGQVADKRQQKLSLNSATSTKPSL